MYKLSKHQQFPGEWRREINISIKETCALVTEDGRDINISIAISKPCFMLMSLSCPDTISTMSVN